MVGYPVLANAVIEQLEGDVGATPLSDMQRNRAPRCLEIDEMQSHVHRKTGP